MDPEKVPLRQKGFFIKDLLPTQRKFLQPQTSSDSKVDPDDLRHETVGFNDKLRLRAVNMMDCISDKPQPVTRIETRQSSSPIVNIASRTASSPETLVTSSSTSGSDVSDDISNEAPMPSSRSDAAENRRIPIQKPIPEHPRLMFPPSVMRLPLAYPVIPASFAQCRGHVTGSVAFRCPCNAGNCPSAFTRLSHSGTTFKGLFSGDQLFDVKDPVPVPVPLPFYVRMREPLSCDGCVKTKRCRRSRTVFTELQLMGLERRFDNQKYLSTPDRVELAESLGLSQIQVKTWYQNRRMKWKKQVLQNGGTEPPTKPKGRPRKITLESGTPTGTDDVNVSRNDVMVD